MIALSRTLLVTAVASLAAVGIGESHWLTRYRDTLAVQAFAARDLEQKIQQAKSDQAGIAAAQKSIEDSFREAAASPVKPDDSAEVARWMEKVGRLKHALAEHPDQANPQFALLTARDWADLALQATFDTPENLARTFAAVRKRAKSLFTEALFAALDSYLTDHDGQLPASLTELLPSLPDQAQDPAMLLHYKLVATGKLADYKGVLVVKDDNIVDVKRDGRVDIDRGDHGALIFINSFPPVDPEQISADVSKRVGDNMEFYIGHAARAFVAAQGRLPMSSGELAPYLSPPLGAGASFGPQSPEEQRQFRDRIAELLSPKH